MRLLANLLPFVKPGALLAAMRGEADWPHNVYRLYWPLARSESFAAGRSAAGLQPPSTSRGATPRARGWHRRLGCARMRRMPIHPLASAMTTVFIARRDALRVRQAQAQLEASRDLKVLGVAASLYRARAALPGVDPDTLLLDLRLDDGAALSLVRGLRERPGERPKVMLVAPDAADPLLFSTLRRRRRCLPARIGLARRGLDAAPTVRR